MRRTSMTKVQKLIRGLSIITKYDPGADLAADHDIIYCGDYKPEKIGEEDLKTLDELGWFKSEDSWAIFT
jgi:hypothetical protein